MKKIVLDKGSALLVTDRLTRKYLCGVDIAEGYVVVADEITAFTDARYFYAAKKSLAAVGVKCELFAGLESIKAHLDSFQRKRAVNNFKTELFIVFIFAHGCRAIIYKQFFKL